MQLALVVVLLIIVVEPLLGQWRTAATMGVGWIICLIVYLFARRVEQRYE